MSKKMVLSRGCSQGCKLVNLAIKIHALGCSKFQLDHLHGHAALKWQVGFNDDVSISIVRQS